MTNSPEQAKRVLHSVCPPFFSIKRETAPNKKDEHQDKLLQVWLTSGRSLIKRIISAY